MKKILVGVASVITISLLSCSKDGVTSLKITGSGAVLTENRNHSNFTKVVTSGSSEVYITRGNTFSVAVRGYENLLPYYETKVEGGVLKLGYRSNLTIRNDNTEIYITMPALNGLQLSGSGNITTSGNFSGNNSFEASLLGSGDISIAQGSAAAFNSYISGSGNIYAFGMLTTNAETVTMGSGDTEITVSDRLKVRIEGSGNVYYKSSPVITATIFGSGSVIPR